MINYARSGGTIISKCIGSLPNVLLFSEVHPLLCASGDISLQAKNWYGIDISASSYKKQISELREKLPDKHIVIRDWTFIDFTPNNFDISPSYKLLNYHVLKEDFEVKPFAIVRDSIDVWLSRGRPNYFFKNYLKYIHTLLKEKITIFKYEDFCENPSNFIRYLCEEINIIFSEKWQEFNFNPKVTGDTQNPDSRAIHSNKIQKLVRKRIASAEARQLNRNLCMIKANNLLDYPAYYDAIEIEKNNNKWLLNTKFFIKTYLHKAGLYNRNNFY